MLILTAASSAEDLVAGLDLGADDHLPKPLDFPVLIARISALARRSQPAHRPCSGLRIWCWTRRVTPADLANSLWVSRSRSLAVRDGAAN